MHGHGEPSVHQEQESVCLPFFDHLSPFSTVFASTGDPESFGISRSWRAARFSDRLKNGENGENGQRHV
jgi:hypothetical protein